MMCRDVWLSYMDILKVCEMYDEDINPVSVSVTLSNLAKNGKLETKLKPNTRHSRFYRLKVF